MSRANTFLRSIDELAWLPIPFLSPEEKAICDAFVLDEFLKDLVDLVEIPVEGLKPTQMRVDQDKVNKYADDGITEGALVLKRGGEFYVYDGHHRTLAAEKRGDQSVKAHVLVLPDNEALTLAVAAELFGLSHTDILISMAAADRAYVEQINEPS